MLICENLQKSFGEKLAVADLSFSVTNGELFALLGSNGAGKSTTIKMILGLLPKDNGNITLQSSVKIGYSPEIPSFPPIFTAEETLRYYCALQGMKKTQIPDEISRVLTHTGLENSKIKVKNYSKGMLQRLAVAQALLGDPDLLILDEPTAGLDALGRVEMIHLLQELKVAGKTILLNSHILNDVERVCDRALIMQAGQVLLEWKKEESNTISLEEIFLQTIGGIA